MKRRLQRILSILCVLALAIGCCSLISLAEEEAEEIRFISVEWEDEDDYDGIRPVSVDMKIGEATVTLDETNNWTGEAVAPADAAWEPADVDGYSRSVRNPNATIVTYSHKVPKTTVLGSVVWVDDNDAGGIRPSSAQLRLLADGEPYGAAHTVNEAGGWSASWDELPVTASGSSKAITYTVDMAAVKGYTVSLSGLTATQTLEFGTLTLNASVSAPEGADVGELELTVTGPDPRMPVTLTLAQLSGGTYSFGQVLPGAYVVQENNADSLVEGYVMDPAASQVGDVVYVRAGESGTLSFSYAYREPVEEEPDEDPLVNAGSLVIQIDGPDPRMPLTITYADFVNGKYELDGLVSGSYSVVEKNAETLVRAYTLTSDSVTGLSVDVGTDGATATLFNQYVPAPTQEPEPELIDIPFTKTWIDNDNQDGNRPASITVHLFADNTEAGAMTVTEAEGWAGVFTGLPRTSEDGTEILYSLREDAVPMYTAAISGYNITNTYQPEVTSLTVSKVWDDDGNAQQIRPTTLAVTLMPLGKVYAISGDSWTLTVNDLPAMLNGAPAEYYWIEQETMGYVQSNVTVDGSVTTFTNRIVRIPPPPEGSKEPQVPKGSFAIFEEYETALGVEVYINHVGDCFD